MELNEKEKTQLKAWIEEGLSLSRIQTLLKETFGLSLTFIETRFLLEDLNLELKETPEPEPEPEPALEPDSKPAPAPEPEAKAQSEPAPEDPKNPQGTSVQVSLDAVKRPDALASGQVTFSDGERLSWQVDTLGRLGLLPGANPEYRPSDADVAEFQKALTKQLESQGLG